jgi:hypothetical protein
VTLLARNWRLVLLSPEEVKIRVHQPGTNQKDCLLLCLAVGDQPKAVAEVKGIAATVGLHRAKKWNISAVLAGSNGFAIRTPQGWELTAPGRDYVRGLLGIVASPVTGVVTSLRAHIAKIKNPDTKAFLMEATDCIQNKQKRAAIVLSWVGAVSVLYEYVVNHHLADFNAEAVRRDTKWRAAKNADGLARMGEGDFLNILEHLAVIGKNVKQDLEACLKRRNACGHPNSFQLGENTVAAHVETLLLNVFAKF